MQQVTPYTDTDAIRGSLGIDSSDCPDSLITESNLELELEVDLQEWLPTHSTIFSTGVGSSATLSEKLYKNYLKLYAQWFCAYELASRFLTFAQITSDGKNQLNRFPKLDLEAVKRNAGDRMGRYKAQLNLAINGVPDVTRYDILKVSVPDYDPVTNV